MNDTTPPDSLKTSIWYDPVTEPEKIISGFEEAEDQTVAILLAGIPDEGGSATKANFEQLVRSAFQGGLVTAMNRKLSQS